ncbi:MAG: TROVE domain-containing protein [Candidatus Eremiobacteraeota bacterium]|nr:TROVE domain-containing protein [Candidatus Eremiobacteraeota bacterium]
MNMLARIFQGRTSGTLQTQRQPGRAQVRNDARGYVYELDRWARVDRFLILGSEGGTYYATEKRLTQENAVNLVNAIREDGKRVVARVIALSEGGRVPKVQPAIFALAACAGFGDEETRRYALTQGLRRVCRTGSHLLTFCSYIEQFRGWGRGLRKGLRGWYEAKPVRELAYQALKYQNREGFTHRDVFRLAHPLATDAERAALYAWIVKGDVPGDEHAALALLRAHATAKAAADADALTCAEFVRTSGLPREALPSTWLKEPRVWEALLPSLPMTALIRNLATLTRLGVLTPKGEHTESIVARITDREALRKARIHPIAVLAALMTYKAGRGARGTGQWTPVSAVVDALDAAFTLAFENVEPTGARTLIGLDVSGSMSCGTIAGVPGLTPRVGAAAMALTAVRTEKDVHVMAFSESFVPFAIGKDESVASVVKRTEALPFMGTDCALPMLYAIKNRLAVDLFIVFTDSETWAGTVHADEALRRYRERMGIPAKLVVVGMTSTNFTIADPNDAGMLDVVGFDTAAPALIADFARMA